MIKNKKSGFVLAYTVIIMGTIFVVIAVISGLLASQSVNSKIVTNKFEEQMFINQQEYNYNNLTFVDNTNYLQNSANAYKNLENVVQYYFDNYIVELSLDNSHLIVYNVEKTKTFLDISH